MVAPAVSLKDSVTFLKTTDSSKSFSAKIVTNPLLFNEWSTAVENTLAAVPVLGLVSSL